MAIIDTHECGFLFENKIPNVENVDPRSFFKASRSMIPEVS